MHMVEWISSYITHRLSDDELIVINVPQALCEVHSNTDNKKNVIGLSLRIYCVKAKIALSDRKADAGLLIDQ